MSAHVFHEIYLHLNWHAKGSRALLTPQLEPAVHQFLTQRCRATKGVYFHGVGGTETHVHVAVNIEPFVCVSDLVGELKGACSHEMNKKATKQVLQWQRGFGVVSFGKKQLPWVLDYIARQKEHHARGKVFGKLEKVTWDDAGIPLEKEV